MAHAGTVQVDVHPKIHPPTFTTTMIEGVAGSFDNVEINHRHADTLIGQLLTLVDATFTDPEQRKAQKSLIKRTVREWLDAEYSLKAGFAPAPTAD